MYDIIILLPMIKMVQVLLFRRRHVVDTTT